MSHTVVNLLSHGTFADLQRVDHTDGQLLDLFVRKRDEEAFAAVVRRHGSMVLAVCRRVLRNAADADDAFQAAFLVLAKRAGSLGRREALAPWLHGVAFNTARKLRYANTRRAGRERPLADAPERPTTGGSEPDADLLALLDEELNRLPERYRAPIVLCDLEGTTRREAARLLGCPEGTVAGRLARARALLAQRLKGRGVTLPGGLLAAVLIRPGVSTATMVPAVVQTVTGPASPRIVNLTERVINAMLARKLKSVAVAVVLGGLVLAGVAGLFQFTANAEAAPPDKPLAKAPPEAKPEKVFTHVPLKDLNPTETATALQRVLPERITVAPVRDENAIIIYATEADTKDVLKALLVAVQDPNLPRVQKLYTFSFRNTRWVDVLEWYEKESGLTNASKSTPKGTVTLVPAGDKKVTFGEITDLINESLMPQKFILVRSDNTFFLHPADEKLDATRVPGIKVADLPSRGKTELVQVTIVLKTVDAEAIEADVKKLLSPFGVAMALPKSRVLQVLDTVGNIRRILDAIDIAQAPQRGPDGVDPGMFPYPLRDVRPSEPESRTYRVKAGTARVIADALKTTGAAHKVISLTARDEVIVLATPEQHKGIPALIEKLDPAQKPDPKK